MTTKSPRCAPYGQRIEAQYAGLQVGDLAVVEWETAPAQLMRIIQLPYAPEAPYFKGEYHKDGYVRSCLIGLDRSVRRVHPDSIAAKVDGLTAAGHVFDIKTSQEGKIAAQVLMYIKDVEDSHSNTAVQDAYDRLYGANPVEDEAPTMPLPQPTATSTPTPTKAKTSDILDITRKFFR